MRRHIACLAVAALSLLPLASCDRPAPDPAFLADTDAWHARRIESLRAPDGWLTLVGLHALRDGDNTVGAAPDRDVRLPAAAPARLGLLAVHAGGLAFLAEPGADLRVAGGGPVAPGVALPLRSDADGEPTVLETGPLRLHVIRRGARLFLRVKDRDSALRRDFRGVERFPADPRWRVTATLRTAARPLAVPVPDVLGGVSQETAPGVLCFRLAGRDCSLIPTGEPGGPLFIVFADLTNGASTYGGGRFLSADPPDPSGRVVLDFNRAYNPPCAFTPYATCPLPPEGNALPLRVEAGEKAFAGARH